MPSSLQAPRGTNDVLPTDQPYWHYLTTQIPPVLEHFGFGRIETPVFEYEQTFIKPIGQQTDIVEKELFEVKRLTEEIGETQPTNDEKKRYVLRPEYTAGIVRAYLEHGMNSLPQPVKLWYWGPAFRYDRPQKGRYRQFTQFGFEIFGEASPTTDAFAIMIIWQILKALRCESSVMIEVNTIGDKTCRSKIRKSMTDYFGKFAKQLCPDCQRRLTTNPLRILDCKEPECQKIAKDAPEIVDLVCATCRTHFKTVLEHLDDLNIPYDLNPRLVRGLDYYTKTTFEVRPKADEQRQSSLGGGGRYDELVAMMGGQATPAIGYAGGIERMIEYIIDQNIKIPGVPKPHLCVVQFGQLARRKSLVVMSQLTRLGYLTTAAFDKESLNAQLKYADKMGTQFTLIIGQKEALADEIIVRNMSDGSQETVPVKELEEVLKRKIKK